MLGVIKTDGIEIEIDRSYFENQRGRLVKELGLSELEAETISKAIKDLTEAKIKEQGKKWSKSVREAFINLITAILIEEIKAISSVSEFPKMETKVQKVLTDKELE